MEDIRPFLPKSVMKQEIFHIIVIHHSFIDSGKCSKMRKKCNCNKYWEDIKLFIFDVII